MSSQTTGEQEAERREDAPDVEPELVSDAELRAPDGGFWVFAYGSLMWDPGFAYAERRAAALSGYARRFCLWSMRYRGTPAAPGLVLGLDDAPSVVTRGVAYRVAAPEADAARAYLIEREMISSAYVERVAPLALLEGSAAAPTAQVDALCYVINRTHRQYARGLTLEDQAEVIERCVGPRGRNCEYLFNTVAHLREAGLSDAEIGELSRLEALVRARRAAQSET